MSLWGPCLCPPSRVGKRTKRRMPGPPFSLQANHTTVECRATCRVPKAEYDTLGSLETRYHCDLCGVDFEADFERYVELRFSVHPAVRQATDATYCIGSPSKARHIVAQQYL